MPSKIHEKGQGALFVGDWNDAQVFKQPGFPGADGKGKCICVLENASYGHMDDYFPIRNNPMPTGETNTDTIEAACKKIDEYLDAGFNVIVHCAAGIERSPLTCVYWMRSRGIHSTLGAAYTHVKIIRSQVADRTHWLPESARLP